MSFLGLQRAVTGTDQINLTLAHGARVSEAVRRVKASYPDLPISEESVMVAVNEKLTRLDGVLETGDSVLFLPFIGGG